MAPGTVLVWSCLEFLPGYSLPVYWGMAFREIAFVSSLLVVVEICFMGSVAWAMRVGLFGSLAGIGGYCLGVG